MKLRINILMLITTLLLSSVSFAQEEKKAKYKSLSKRDLRLDGSFPSLLSEAKEVMISDPNEALNKVEEALALSITNKSTYNQAKCYILIGAINENIEEWALALENYQKAHSRLVRDYRTTPDFIKTLTGLGNSFTHLSDYASALQYYQLKLETATNQTDIVTAQLEIAETYYKMGDYDASQNSLNSAEVVGNAANSNQFQSRSRAISAKIYAQNDDLEAAEDFFEQSQEFDLESDSVSVSNEAYIDDSKDEIVKAYSRQNRVEDEISFRNKNIETNRLKGEPLKISKEKREIGNVLIASGRTADAIIELEEAVEIADSLGNAKEQVGSYQALATAYENVGREDDALKAYNKFSEAVNKITDENDQEQEQKATIIRKQNEIDALTKDLALDESEYALGVSSIQLRDNQLWFQQLAIYGLLGLLGIVMIASFTIYRNAKKSKVMSQLLALKSLRSQMNPHFIFNALNSVNQFIAKNDERAANKFLTEFSKLMRLVLDSSQKDFITLLEEKEIIALYLKLEHYRFRDKFTYEFTIDPVLSLESLEIPPMLIQPYIENAIWHGLRYKEEKGELMVSLAKKDNDLVITITDDGIGRNKSQALKTENQKKHNSTGLKNTQERIEIVNKVYKKQHKIHVEDLNEDGSGTKVEIILPLEGN